MKQVTKLIAPVINGMVECFTNLNTSSKCPINRDNATDAITLIKVISNQLIRLCFIVIFWFWWC